MIRTELTPRQQNILDYVQEFQSEHGFPPSIREIGEFFGIRSTNGVSDHLRAIEKKGFLKSTGHQSRSLQIVRDDDGTTLSTHKQSQMAEPQRRHLQVAGRAPALQRIVPGAQVSVPMLGKVAAGQPILAIEEADDSVVVDSFLLGGATEVFGLRVVGDSMIDAGIFSGDFLFVRKTSTALPGDIVVAMIEGEATVKRYFPEGDRIRFQPENREMQPIYVNRSDLHQVDLLGTVVGVYRKLV